MYLFVCIMTALISSLSIFYAIILIVRITEDGNTKKNTIKLVFVLILLTIICESFQSYIIVSQKQNKVELTKSVLVNAD